MAGGSLVAVVQGKPPRLYSATGGKFPVGESTVAYFTVDDGAVFEWIHDHGDPLLKAATAAAAGRLTLFAVWPGNTRSDVFVIDQPLEFKARLEDYHLLKTARRVVSRKATAKSSGATVTPGGGAFPMVPVAGSIISYEKAPPDVEEEWADEPPFKMMPAPADADDDWNEDIPF